MFFTDGLFLNSEKLIDISWPIAEGATSWKDTEERAVTFTSFRTWDRHQARESYLRFGLHSGTHVDAPSHFLEGARCN